MAVVGAVIGLQKVVKELKRKQDEILEAQRVAIYHESLHIIGKSKKNLVPVETGRLRATAYAAPPASKDNPVGQCGYGTDYAVAVHENRRGVNFNIGESGFLRKPLEEARLDYTERLANRTRKVLAFGLVLGSSDIARRPKDFGEKKQRKIRRELRRKAKRAKERPGGE